MQVNGAPVLNRIFLDAEHGPLTRAYWQWLLLTRPGRDAKSLAADLRRPPTGADHPAAEQFIAKVAELAAQVAAIAQAEAMINERLYGLYGLSDGERALVEAKNSRRNSGANRS